MPTVEFTDEELGELLALLDGLSADEMTDNLTAAKTKMTAATKPPTEGGEAPGGVG